MILIIDAYNILKQVFPTYYITEKQRVSFLSLIQKYVASRKHQAIIVFDGGPFDRPWSEQHNGVTIVYSGTRESADDFIRNYILKNNKHDLLLISSDNAICAWANKFDKESIDAMTFYAILRQEVHEHTEEMHTELVKTSRTKTPELDVLMEQIEYVPQKGEKLKQDRKGTAQKLSKKDRKMVKKVSKL